MQLTPASSRRGCREEQALGSLTRTRIIMESEDEDEQEFSSEEEEDDDSSTGESIDTAVEEEDPGRFSRASLLQLLSMCFGSNVFAKMRNALSPLPSTGSNKRNRLWNCGTWLVWAIPAAVIFLVALWQHTKPSKFYHMRAAEYSDAGLSRKQLASRSARAPEDVYEAHALYEPIQRQGDAAIMYGGRLDFEEEIFFSVEGNAPIMHDELDWEGVQVVDPAWLHVTNTPNDHNGPSSGHSESDFSGTDLPELPAWSPFDEPWSEEGFERPPCDSSRTSSYSQQQTSEDTSGDSPNHASRAVKVREGEHWKNSKRKGLSNSHSNAEVENLTCRVCGKKFRRRCDLRKHMWKHDLPVRCRVTTCNRRFETKTLMERHVAEQHVESSNQPRYYCNHADCIYAENGFKNGFARKDAWKRHQVVHTSV